MSEANALVPWVELPPTMPASYIQVLVYLMAALLLVQLSANVTGRLMTKVLDSLASRFSLAKPSCCGHLGCEPVYGTSLHFSLLFK